MKNLKKIAVFFGGCSTEYEVSLQSACAVIQSIDTDRYTSVPIGIDRQSGAWFRFRGAIELIAKNRWQAETTCTPVFPSTDQNIHGHRVPIIGRICCQRSYPLPLHCTITSKTKYPFSV